MSGRNPDYDKLIMTVNLLTPEEIQIFLMLAHTILMERNYLVTDKEDMKNAGCD